jgi:hypothetical protein
MQKCLLLAEGINVCETLWLSGTAEETSRPVTVGLATLLSKWDGRIMLRRHPATGKLKITPTDCESVGVATTNLSTQQQAVAVKRRWS